MACCRLPALPRPVAVHAANQLLAALPPAFVCAGEGPGAFSLYTCLLHNRLTADSFAKRREQLAADPAARRAVAGVLLECCLPTVAAAVS